jgi:Fe2+ transport system protein FeoA
MRSAQVKNPVETRLRLADCAMRELVELVHIELPEEQAECLLERGIVPGCSLCAVRRSPSGDPIVEVDGMVLAMRREMAGCLYVRRRLAGAA